MEPVHPADSKPMDAVDFVNGWRIRPGFVFETFPNTVF